MVSVVTLPILAGQFVTVGAQDVIVYVLVVYTVEVVYTDRDRDLVVVAAVEHELLEVVLLEGPELELDREEVELDREEVELVGVLDVEDVVEEPVATELEVDDEQLEELEALEAEVLVDEVDVEVVVEQLEDEEDEVPDEVHLKTDMM